MFDIGWQEIFVLAVLAIIVIGPKDLPRAIKVVTQWVKKARYMARDLQDGLDDMVREAELDDIKSQANKIMNDETFDPTGTLADEFDVDTFEKDWSETVEDIKAATNPEKDSTTKGAGDTAQALLSDGLPQEHLGLLDSSESASPKGSLSKPEKSLVQKQPSANVDSGAEPKKHDG